jgi:hypothetical protein
MSTFKRVVSDMSTSQNGDYDPARVVGYGVSVLGALVFLALTVYVTVLTKAFDASAFAIGLLGISTTVAAAAGGVFIKRSTEVPLSPTAPPLNETAP